MLRGGHGCRHLPTDHPNAREQRAWLALSRKIIRLCNNLTFERDGGRGSPRFYKKEEINI